MDKIPLNYSKLNKKELKYYNIIKNNSGVLYITSNPGIAKSAISRSIAQKLGLEYHDLRLSMVDETDVGLFPKVIETKDGNFLDHVIPLWAHEANKRPTLIHFEELNRAQLSVRNAALQILLERSIGRNFKFNDNVYFIASGNLGSQDGTDVEDFDSALNNRLIHLKHTLDLKEWIEYYANDNIYEPIVKFLLAYPTNYYVNPTTETSAYATPRSWTFLSDYIKGNITNKSNVNDVIDLLSDTGHAFIGNTITPFLSYLKTSSTLNINDIINNFEGCKAKLSSSKRDKYSELLVSLKELTRDIENSKYNDAKLSNIISFLKIISDEERASYLLYLVDKSKTDNDNIRFILMNFIDEVTYLRKKNKQQVDG